MVDFDPEQYRKIQKESARQFVEDLVDAASKLYEGNASIASLRSALVDLAMQNGGASFLETLHIGVAMISLAIKDAENFVSEI